MCIERNEMFGDVMFGVEESRDEVCKVQQIKTALPEGTFSAIAGMLLVNADFKFETVTPQHTFRLTRVGKQCSVGLSVTSDGGDEWVSGGWTDSIEYWEMLEELGELSEEVHDE